MTSSHSNTSVLPSATRFVLTVKGLLETSHSTIVRVKASLSVCSTLEL